jgi:hypothetical protein
MRTIETKVYQFNELNDEAKERAIEKCRYFQVEGDWWEHTYEDAKRIGLKLTSFDLDRNRHAKGEFLLSAVEVAQNILNEHGETCETYKTASNFLAEHEPVFAAYMDEESEHYESPEKEEELIELEEEFLKSLLEDYSILLQDEYEYLTSDESVIEMIIGNSYEFTEEGEIYF